MEGGGGGGGAGAPRATSAFYSVKLCVSFFINPHNLNTAFCTLVGMEGEMKEVSVIMNIGEIRNR